MVGHDHAKVCCKFGDSENCVQSSPLEHNRCQWVGTHSRATMSKKLQEWNTQQLHIYVWQLSQQNNPANSMFHLNTSNSNSNVHYQLVFLRSFPFQLLFHVYHQCNVQTYNHVTTIFNFLFSCDILATYHTLVLWIGRVYLGWCWWWTPSNKIMNFVG